MESKRDPAAPSIFSNYSMGVETARDAWATNSSRAHLERNMSSTIDFYRFERKRVSPLLSAQNTEKLDDLIRIAADRISWSHEIKQGIVRGRDAEYAPAKIVQCHYSPFHKRWLYFDRLFNKRVFQMPHIFPVTGEPNLVI